nr:bacteriocin biosynthesis protein AlbD [uncultured Bacillus sp.]
MNSFSLMFHLLFRQYYGRYKRKDIIRIVLGLSILVVFEIGLIKQAHIDESVLLKGYIIGALLFMNIYIIFLSVYTQWKEKFMTLSCVLPIQPRSFWTAEIAFLFIDSCLRRTLFFFILPIFLFVNHDVSVSELLYWLCKFSFLTIYSIVVGIAMGNLLSSKRIASLFIHIAVVLLAFYSILNAPAWYVWICVLQVSWIVMVDFPKFLQVHRQFHNRFQWITPTDFSFYKREWNRFFSSKAMILNYVIMVGFIAFFCYNLMKSNVAGLSIAVFIAVALLLTCSPIALLYSIEKDNHKLLLTLPIKKWSLFWQKYAFYAGFLLIGFAVILICLFLLSGQSISILKLIQCIELLLAGGFIRLKVDECKPIFDWQTEQKLWSNFKKYQSYLYCAPLFLTNLLGTLVSFLCIPIVVVIVLYVLNKQEGGFFG